MHRLFFWFFLVFFPICVPHCCLSVLSLALQCISLATKNSHIFSCSVSPLPSVCLAVRKPSKQAANKLGYRLHPIYVKYSKHTEAFNAIRSIRDLFIKLNWVLMLHKY